MSTATPTRIVSLDQFRGYTVAGMLLVNFLGGYVAVVAVAPSLKHYNTHCSYADTIMPQFLFAVGFAYRLTFLKRRETLGAATASWQAVKRGLGLILLGAVVYHLDGGAKTWEELTKLGWSGFLATAFERNVFQTLVHIAVTSLWVLPVIGAGPAARVGYLLFSALLHLSISHPTSYAETWGKPLGDWFGWHKSYYEWVMTRPGIDGGPLGFLTWTIPLLVGSLVSDALAAAERPPLARFLAWSGVLMLAGYGLSCLSTVDPTPAAQWRHEFHKDGPRFDGVKRVPPGNATHVSSWQLVEPPFARPTGPVNVWTMSQRAGSVSYLVFSTGFALAVYVLFIVACDRGGLRVGLFRTFGTNALAAYVLHDLVSDAVKPWVPGDSALWFALVGFGIFFGVSYLFTRYLETNRIFLRL